jgi:tetratricopeptide (TPR) repeat protein
MHADLRAGRLARCSAALAWLARRDGLISEDWMVRARIEQLEGRLDAAVESLSRVDDRDALAPQARLMGGVIELERHRSRAAERALRKAVELDPGQIAARLELIQLYSRQQRFAELDAQFDALADRNQLDFEHLRFWFMTRNAPWDAKDDLEPLRQMVEADPEDYRSRLALSQGLRRVGRSDEAAPILDSIPESVSYAQAARAQMAIDRGDLDRAERLLADDRSDDAQISQLRGRLALLHGDAAAAARWFWRAYSVRPDDRATLAGLATTLRLAGQTADAEPFLVRVKRFDEFSELISRITAPNSAEDGQLHRRLGSLCEAVGRTSEARAWYRLAIASNPLDPEAQRALFRFKGCSESRFHRASPIRCTRPNQALRCSPSPYS